MPMEFQWSAKSDNTNGVDIIARRQWSYSPSGSVSNTFDGMPP